MTLRRAWPAFAAGALLAGCAPQPGGSATANGPSTWVKTPSRWLSYDPARRQATLTFTLAPEAQDSGYLLNGAPTLSQSLTIPPRWSLLVHATNNTNRSLAVGLLASPAHLVRSGPVVPAHAQRSVHWASIPPGRYRLAWLAVGSSTAVAALTFAVQKTSHPAYTDPYSKAAKYVPMSPGVKRPG